jgi:hypothetical protein
MINRANTAFADNSLLFVLSPWPPSAVCAAFPFLPLLIFGRLQQRYDNMSAKTNAGGIFAQRLQTSCCTAVTLP